MSNLQIKGYEIRNGCYIRDDVPATDFILRIILIIGKETNQYKIFTVKNCGAIYETIVSSSQIRRSRFLNEVPVLIEDEKDFYTLVRRAIFGKQYSDEEILYQTDCNGLQEVNGKKMFVFTNGSISTNGFHAEVYSGVEGAYFPKEAFTSIKRQQEVIDELFRQYNRNREVFYPLFLMNIMAISNGYFRSIGERQFMKLTLWLDGASGSGKTELAKTVGTYIFTDKKQQKEVISVTGNRKYALNYLAQSSGMVCILDDVKCEQVRERRNSVLNIVDDLIRSIFQGKLTDGGTGKTAGAKWIDSCAIITGEYMETNESQNARMLYLKTDGFLKQEKNSNALRVLQEHPIWLTTLCGGYAHWFLKKMEESSFPELIKERIKRMRTSEKIYEGINNAERLNENRNMLEMAAMLAEMYFRETGMTEDFCKRFWQNAGQSIKAVSDSTFYLLGGKQMVILKVMEQIFSKCSIRKAQFQKKNYGSLEQYYQQYFWIYRKEDFVWIEDYKRSLMKRDEYIYEEEQPYLIIREKRFMDLFQTEIGNLVQEGNISSETADELRVNCLKILRECQIIFKRHRTDSKWGRPAADYPVFDRRTEYYYDDDEYNFRKETVICHVDCEPVIQMNPNHSCIAVLKDRMAEDDTADDIFDGVPEWRLEGMWWEELLKSRKAFASGKSLYKE